MSIVQMASRSNIEERYFQNINKRPDGTTVSGAYYIHVWREDHSKIDKVSQVDLGKIIFWNPTPADGYFGKYTFARTFGAECIGKIPLGLDFAEAMLDRPWPDSWNGISIISCPGTKLIKSIRARRVDTLYPSLERNKYNRSKIAINLRPFDRKPPKGLRMAFYPTEN